MNIYESMTSVLADIDHIGKDKKSQQGYAYRGVDQVLNTLQPLFAKHKIFCTPEVLEVVGREERQTKSGGTQTYSILRVKYTFYAEDGSSVSAVVIGEAMDSGDKSMNKCMSVAFKYACFQSLCIPTEETTLDPDDKSEELKPKKPDKPSRLPPAPETLPPWETPTNDQLEELQMFGGTLADVAKWKKKQISAVSHDDVEAALKIKRAVKEANDQDGN